MRSVRWFFCAGVLFGCDTNDSADSQPGETEGASTTADAATSDADSTSGSTEGSTTASATSSDSTTGDSSTTGDPASSTGAASTGAGATEGSTGDAADEIPPADPAALTAWLQSGAYETWTGESAVHPSTGPHFGNVRTFLNGALFDSFDAGGSTHPTGACAVKELYGPGDEVRGWAVVTKRPADEGQWDWFEVYDGEVLADGVGLGVCESCHGSGTDQVLTPFPLQ